MQHVVKTRWARDDMPEYLLDRGGTTIERRRFALVPDTSHATIAPNRAFARQLLVEWRAWAKDVDGSPIAQYQATQAVVVPLSRA